MNGFSNFPDCFVLACIITKEIFFPRHWYCFVKGHSPPNNAIFINVYLCIVAFFEQGNNAFRPMSSLGQLFSQINLKKRKKISPTRLSIGFKPI